MSSGNRIRFNFFCIPFLYEYEGQWEIESREAQGLISYLPCTGTTRGFIFLRTKQTQISYMYVHIRIYEKYLLTRETIRYTQLKLYSYIHFLKFSLSSLKFNY